MFRLFGLADMVDRKVKLVHKIDIPYSERCVIIVLEKEHDNDPVDMVVLQPEGCNTCYGQLKHIDSRKFLPKEVKEWIFDNYVE